ncbi:unnamed protein product [Owenia fusiformis]|uniref:Fanconi anemia group A protein n=1 Tax=Owenia fusiformis TaxID=6347 RepID=A0A8S4NGF5_OWEFU|nr:unnamed protein product [Owenia fusiformis]
MAHKRSIDGKEYTDVNLEETDFSGWLANKCQKLNNGQAIASRGDKLETCFKVISHYQSLPALQNEALHKISLNDETNYKGIQASMCECSKTNRPSDHFHTVSSLYHLLLDEAKGSSLPFSVLATDVCVSKLKECLGQSQDKSDIKPLLNTEEQAKVDLIMSLMKLIISKGHKMSASQIAKNCCTKQTCLPLEMVWNLHNEGFMKLELYLKCLVADQSKVKNLISQCCHLCVQSTMNGDDKKCTQIVKDVFSYLVQYGYVREDGNTSTVTPLQKVAVVIMDTTIKKLFKICDDKDRILNPVILIHQVNTLPSTAVKQFCSHTISTLLRFNPVLKVSQALELQSQWTYAKSHPFITHVYQQLLLPFETFEILDFVRHLLEEQEVNWQAVLTFIATLSVSLPDAPQHIKDLASKLISKALVDCELDSIIIALLLARQASMEGPHLFQSYSQWFKETFGDANKTPANNRKSFTFLMRFLSDIVPFEPVDHLKAHILSGPYVPDKCRAVYSDYVTLAKTRLADLKEPIEEMSIYSGNPATSGGIQGDQINSDVETAIAMFEKSSKIPTTLLEASIFRKPFFVGKFLPILMKPRPLPDIADPRMRLIDELQKIDKVPQNMYNKYKEGCQKEAEKLFQGVFSDEADESMEELLETPIQQLETTLAELLHLVAQSKDTNSQMSVLARKIELVLPSINAPSGDTYISIDKPTPIDAKTLEVTDILLNSFCKILAVSLKLPKPSLTWGAEYLAIISQHSHLKVALFTRIVTLLLKQGLILEEHHIDTLLATLVIYERNKDTLGHVKLVQCVHQDPRDVVEGLFETLSYRTQDEMLLHCRVCVTYAELSLKYSSQCGLQYASVKDSACLQAYLVEKIHYMVPRIFPSCRFVSSLSSSIDSVPMQLENQQVKQMNQSLHLQSLEAAHRINTQLQLKAAKLYSSKEFQSYISNQEFRFKRWLNLEMNVQPTTDLMSDIEWTEYCDWVIHGNYTNCRSNMHVDIIDILVQHQLKYSSHSVDKCREYSCSKQQTEGRISSRLRLISLLQRLVLTDHCAPGWVCNYLHDALMNQDSETVKEAIIGESVSIVVQLPPHIWFTSQPFHKVTAESIQQVSLLVNDHLRHYCYDIESGLLSYNLASHLLKGVGSCSAADVTMFLSQCPVVYASTVFYWRRCNYWMAKSPVLSELENSIANMYSPTALLRLTTDIKDDKNVKNKHWLNAVAIYSDIIKRDANVEDILEQKHPIPHKVDYIPHLHLGDFTVHCYVMLLLIYGQATQCLHGLEVSNSTIRAVAALANSWPDIVMTTVREYIGDPLMASLFPDVLQAFLPYTMLRVLILLPESTVRSEFIRKQNKDTISDLYHQALNSTLGATFNTFSEVLTLKHWSQIKEFVETLAGME